MKMDSAGGVTSIGTTFEVGMFFGLQNIFFENRLKKASLKGFFDRFTDSRPMNR